MDPLASPRAANRAADACRIAASALRECTAERGQQAAIAREDWSGPHREAFDARLNVVEHDASRLVEDMLRLAGALDDVAAVLRRDAGGGHGW